MPHAAAAVSITNLDTVEHQLSIAPTPGNPDSVTIAPGRTWRGPATTHTLRLLDNMPQRAIRAQDLDEYVIWPGSEMTIQKRRKFKNKQ